jgi:hypothetical protein
MQFGLPAIGDITMAVMFGLRAFGDNSLQKKPGFCHGFF